MKLHTTHENKYLGVIIQSDLKFTTHIEQKVARANQQLGMIKRALHGATKKSQAACLLNLMPVLEYQIYDIEMVQSGIYVT